MYGVNRLPSWFRQALPDTQVGKITVLLDECNVNTVCKEARCPNQSNCFKQAKVTFLILGTCCTRNCRFCNVETRKLENNANYDKKEPERIADAVRKLKLDFVVITSVTRDDLADGGAGAFQETICRIRTIDKKIKIEVLIPDFKGSIMSLKNVIQALPDVIAHNIETVVRLYPDVRPLADYRISLGVLKNIKEINPEMTTKSSILLGMGEIEGEVINTMEDLRESNCDILTLGQYLAPSAGHYPVKEFIPPEKFNRYEGIARDLGFKSVLSGPLVRSSYRAREVFHSIGKYINQDILYCKGVWGRPSPTIGGCSAKPTIGRLSAEGGLAPIAEENCE